MVNKTRLTVRFNEEKIKQIKKNAIELGLSPSEFLGQCFEAFEGKVFPEIEALKKEVKKYKTLYLAKGQK